MRGMNGMIWSVTGVALLALPLAAHAAGGGDGRAAEDPRWLPWIGCWQSESPADAEGAPAPLVCVDYLDDADGVAITTRTGGEVVAREELRADGLSVRVEEGGCGGEQWAEWSSDGHRLFLYSEMACGEGVIRSTRGVLAIQDSGRRWLEVHAVSAGDAEPVLGVTSFRPAPEAAVQGAGVRAGDEGRQLAVNTARTLAGRAMEPSDVSEAVREVGSDVARALIVEAGQPFALDVETLRVLKAEGVPEEVLDVMVAVTYPERFSIEGGAREADYRAAPRPSDAAPRATGPMYGGYMPFGFGYRSPFYYGFSPYGYGSAWGYPRGYWGAPVVIVRPPTVEQRGRVVRGRGYTAPSATGRPARARGGEQAAPSRAPAAPSRAPAVRPGRRAQPSAGTTRAAPRVTPPQRSSGEERRARPRTGGGGKEGR